ncbi:MAG: methionine--tRNA ligase [Nitrospinae bacterium]|nr:methionine--tRNA ligase [Nitrospinota bacterium]
MNMKFYITTPIYYVNDIPHIGHAYTTVAADVMARYKRLCDYQVFFLTGTDEHGQKVDKAARDRGLKPKEHADLMVENFKKLWKKLNISNDAFIRTTDKEHIKTVQGLLQKLFDEGKIEKRSYSGWYCVPDERFWTEKEIMGGNCPDCGRPVEHIEEENYFFLMSKYQEDLKEYIEKNPKYILPETRKNEVLGFLKNNKLGDLCISRPKQRLSWGIPLPFDENYVTYVWFDALVNYYSATKYRAPTDVDWWPADLHLVGKDILTTHSVYWSAMLLALKKELPKTIFAHGWWTVEGSKMSKSFGNVVDPLAVVNEYGVDQFRYFLLREFPFGLDGNFSIRLLKERINGELANDLGNLLSRTLALVIKNKRPGFPENITAKVEKDEFIEFIRVREFPEFTVKFSNSFKSFMDHGLKLNHTILYIMDAVKKMNIYIDKRSPWGEKDSDMLSYTLYTLLEGLRIIAVYLFPFIPESAQKIWDALGIDKKIEHCKLDEEVIWGKGSFDSMKIQKGRQLFPRVEEKMEIGDKVTATVTESTVAAEERQLISIDEFAKVDLRVGEIKQAEKIEKSKKLLKLKVDIGTEERQVVAGIAEHYTPEELIGKKIVLVANLKPAKLMGTESHGMVLAAGGDGRLVLIGFDGEVKLGSKVK